jgi:mRNA interferase MazF
LNPGDVVVGVLAGALENKVRPAVVIASREYLVEHPDVLVGILTTKTPRRITSSDCVLQDWQSAGLRAESWFRAYVLTMHRSELNVIGHLSEQDWSRVKDSVRAAFAIREGRPGNS